MYRYVKQGYITGMADTPRCKPRWFGFRLRMLLVLLIPIVLASGWLGVKMWRFEEATRGGGEAGRIGNV